MVEMFWLMVLGYLLVALGELIPVTFRSNKEDWIAPIHICLVALGYALAWPVRYLRPVRRGE